MRENNTIERPKHISGFGENFSMDKPVLNEFKNKKKIISYSAISLLVVSISLVLIIRDNNSKLNVELDKITIEKVKKDSFQDYISIIGTVEPIQTVYLDATEGGRVDNIFIREGTMVQKGDPIIRLSNDNLLLEISNYEAEVSRAINDLHNMRVNLENQQINNQSQLVEYYFDLLKLERIFKNNYTLVKDGFISQEEFLLCKENFERKKKLFDLLKQKTQKDSVSIISRIVTSEESVESMQKNLANIRNRLKKLTITAPVSGELAILSPELGKVIGYGTSIGSINILDSYKLRAEIDEHYIDRVKQKLTAFCEFSGKDYRAYVIKIYPEVKNGQFSVDMVFTQSIPDNLRIGQTSRIKLELGKPDTALIIPRGNYYQSTGGQWIYVIDNNNKKAIKRNIKIGRQNPSYYEVLDGLYESEHIIISDYERFGDADELLLK